MLNSPMETAQTSTDPPSNESKEALTRLEKEVWQQLAAAPVRREHPFSTCTLATRTPEGWPDARTVVLRHADETFRTLCFYTDSRAPKVTQLQASPQAALLFWDAEQQVQLRCRVTARVHHTDSLSRQQWKQTWAGSRKMYLSEFVPGSPQAAPYPGFPPYLGDELPSPELSETGYPNFAVVVCTVVLLDVLQLSRAGQKRAEFGYNAEKIGQTWLAP